MTLNLQPLNRISGLPRLPRCLEDPHAAIGQGLAPEPLVLLHTDNDQGGHLLQAGAVLAFCVFCLIAVCNTSTAQPTSGSRVINLSILTSLATAGDTFTLGYVVGGRGTSGNKPLVIRAAGPSLGALGVPGSIDDPKLELFTGSVKIGENDNWGGSAAIADAMARVGAFAFTGPTSRDATAALMVGSGDNSVKVSAVGDGTGTVIAEIYDATPSGSFTGTTPRLVNVSVLKQLGTGFTVGFVVGGNGTKNVLVRAIGPTLGSAFGVPGAASDPQFTLYSGQTAIGSNDNWGSTTALKAAFTSTGAFVLADESRDAAAVVSLQPGGYTVVISGVGNTFGNVLVEVYEVPDAPDPASLAAPSGFSLIPAGTFTMGSVVTANVADTADGERDAPPHQVTLTAFYLAKTETTWAEWVAVQNWAVAHGYADLALVGSGKADSHPVHSVSWYDVVKWCNARSEKDGFVPVYYTNDAQTTMYRTGSVNVTNAQVKSAANGYRLPTEAEWEYAARGGLVGKRFPWGDTITHQQANYASSSSYSYDVSATRGFHPTYATGSGPYTSPVGSFAANDYGLADMVGNLCEWCWDWYGSYNRATVSAPLGPLSGTYRVYRGGSWGYDGGTGNLRSAYRTGDTPGGRGVRNVGFRVARSLVP
jgi:formylglycine-generating enzyme required for sulfatase activity